jgi:hypothetical protein
MQKKDFKEREHKIKRHEPNNVCDSAALIIENYKEVVGPIGEQFYDHGKQIDLNEEILPLKPVQVCKDEACTK